MRLPSADRLRKRLSGGSILEALSFIAGKFLQASHIDQIIYTCLERLGAVTEVSRIAIRENYTDTDGNMRAMRKYEWAARGVASQTANEDYSDLSYNAVGLEA